MRVIRNARDVLIHHFESSDGMRPPLVLVLAQRDDCQLAVHFRHSPGYCQAFIVPEVWRFVDGTGKAICNAESSIGANELAQSIPVTLIEPVDVEMQKP